MTKGTNPARSSMVYGELTERFQRSWHYTVYVDRQPHQSDEWNPAKR
jgi:hypothetical protein